jgi:hypothetical protein
MVHFLEQIYGRKVEMDDMVTVVRFSQISDRPSEIRERLRPDAPAQNWPFISEPAGDHAVTRLGAWHSPC